MILVSFCRILDGHSDEINLFWHCSFPLSENEAEKRTEWLCPFHQNY